ncbi:hypothetical protein ULMS_10630 [Patiriisocius marinistellae]|uniref:Uncharacterized protein n=1 Tax=Patiriisocius marinistellae TaxID=2494560 RepID=A0A5J4FZT0_9FLAO|nr:hypothetical protein [Patiriisocius marinistellae]GEQ85555.1 hypothetical protein ULMS_10630 [Patiriisocius marinistellae]
MSINQIQTPLDSAVLETKEQYKVYYKIVAHAFDSLVESLSKKQICEEMEILFISQYAELLSYSLEAFRIKYLFDDEEKMRIDLTESGFPNFLEFRYLYNDLALKHEHVSKLPKIEDLKSQFLETLLKDKEEVSDFKLHQAASIVYYTSVEQKYIFKKFIQGKITRNKDVTNGEYMVSWSFYDVVHNRPFVCFMYFDLFKTTLEEYTQQIYEVIESVADRNMSLDMMAYAIDKKLTKLFPKKLRKIDLGPLHNVFAKDELEVTHVILKGIIDKTLDISAYAISLQLEEINSTDTFSEGGFFNKQYLQIWETKKPESYVFTSHRVLQVLYDNIPQFLNTLSQSPIEIPALKL